MLFMAMIIISWKSNAFFLGGVMLMLCDNAVVNSTVFDMWINMQFTFPLQTQFSSQLTEPTWPWCGAHFWRNKIQSLFTYLFDASPYMCSNIFRGSYGYYSYDISLGIMGIILIII